MSWFWDDITKKYAIFSGRSNRREFWFFHLFYLLIPFAIILVGALISGFLQGISLESRYPNHFMQFISVLANVWLLAFFIPSLAVAVRRLHDIGQSGWTILVAFIPFLGAITLLIMFLVDGEGGDNKYGPNPKPT
jgi:uncharacterized membrane protein YhaH (DUF805 family)